MPEVPHNNSRIVLFHCEMYVEIIFLISQLSKSKIFLKAILNIGGSILCGLFFSSIMIASMWSCHMGSYY